MANQNSSQYRVFFILKCHLWKLKYIQDRNCNINFTGPVVFPNPPSDQPVESSGVVAGASGFGFVPGQAGASEFAYHFLLKHFHNLHFIKKKTRF